MQHHVEEHDDSWKRANSNVQKHVFSHRMVLRKAPCQTDNGGCNGGNLDSFHGTQLQTDIHVIPLEGYRFTQPIGNVNNVGENDVA